MFLKKIPSKRTGRTFLSIVEGYRDPASGKVRHKTITPLGYIDELEKEVPDPISHFKRVAKEMTKEAKKLKEPISFNFTVGDRIKKT